jgi:hypothetical protein
MLTEPEYFNFFIPFVKSSLNLKNQCSKLPSNISVGQCAISIPYLVEDSNVSLYTAVYDRLSTHKSFIIIA